MSDSQPVLPEVVAHRGNAHDYPENTVQAIESALQYGIRFVEFDVQMTADAVPVLLHDAGFARTAGMDRPVHDLPSSEVESIEVNESERFGSTFSGIHPPTLRAVVELLSEWPEATAFVELKSDSIDRFGARAFVSEVVQALQPITTRAVIVSYDTDTIRLARKSLPIGWVLREWSAEVRRQANSLGPDFLFCNHLKIPADEFLWTGDWRWVLYDIADPEMAPGLAARGTDFVETMAVARFVNHPLYQGAGRT